MTTATLVEPRTSGFHDLGLSPQVLAALERAAYHQPTPIQAAVIPKVLSGHDVIGQAQTGTGKTASFLLPFLSQWVDRNEPGPQALVLVPTRELVVQVAEEAKKLAPSRNCRALPIYGGQRIRTQLTEMRKGFSIAVGSPGRILDHLARGTISFDRVKYVVLDEADRMLDIGFRPDIEKILRRCPKDRQTLLLSATLPDAVLRLSRRYMVDPLHLAMTPEKPAVEKIKQFYISVDENRKFDLLLRVLEREHVQQCIIFCQRKRSAHQLYKDLREHHRQVSVMHGDLSQPLREKIMRKFRDGSVSILVATDVVGRGIDVTGISHIINYDLPDDPENYVHRIGRTGRMGRDGVAIAFVTREQGEQLTAIECLLNRQIERMTIPGFEAIHRPQPKKKTAAAAEPEPTPEPAKTVVPVFGRRTRRYSRRL